MKLIEMVRGVLHKINAHADNFATIKEICRALDDKLEDKLELLENRIASLEAKLLETARNEAAVDYKGAYGTNVPDEENESDTEGFKSGLRYWIMEKFIENRIEKYTLRGTLGMLRNNLERRGFDVGRIREYAGIYQATLGDIKIEWHEEVRSYNCTLGASIVIQVLNNKVSFKVEEITPELVYDIMSYVDNYKHIEQIVREEKLKIVREEKLNKVFGVEK
jgi:hypothetical protein